MSTHRIKYLRRIGKPTSESYSLDELSKFSGVRLSILKEVFDRGIGAAKSNPESVRIKRTFEKNPNLKQFPRSARLSPEQWAYARVYSFLDKGTTYHTADADLAKKSGY